EDGIRDRNVTGVQTCALPISLQAGDTETLATWREIVAESQHYFDQVYTRLGVLLRAEDSRGESSYNDRLARVAEELAAAGIAVRSEERRVGKEGRQRRSVSAS